MENLSGAHTDRALVPYDGLRSQLPAAPGCDEGSETMKATLTDSHFLVPLIVFCIGLALLILLH